MVSQGWYVVSWKICVGLKVVTPITIDKLNFLLLIRTILSKSFTLVMLSRPYPHLGENRGRDTVLGLLSLLFGHWWAHFIFKTIRK